MFEIYDCFPFCVMERSSFHFKPSSGNNFQEIFFDCGKKSFIVVATRNCDRKVGTDYICLSQSSFRTANVAPETINRSWFKKWKWPDEKLLFAAGILCHRFSFRFYSQSNTKHTINIPYIIHSVVYYIST